MGAVSDRFYERVLSAIGAPVSPNALALMRAWQRAEGGSATFNPFNTTQPWPGATAYNKVGVRNYASEADGIAATAKTLLNGRYAAIVAGLRAGAAPEAVAKAIAASPWGSGSLVLKVLRAEGGRLVQAGGRAAAAATPSGWWVAGAGTAAVVIAVIVRRWRKRRVS